MGGSDQRPTEPLDFEVGKKKVSAVDVDGKTRTTGLVDKLRAQAVSAAAVCQENAHHSRQIVRFAAECTKLGLTNMRKQKARPRGPRALCMLGQVVESA